MYKLDERERCESYGSILEHAQLAALTVESSAPAPVESRQWSMHSFGAMFCEMRVNAITGELRVSRFLGSFDCGRILNAKTAASQFRGGIIMGRSYKQLQAALPDAEVANANPLLEQARFVKRDDEIAFMERAVALAEHALDVFEEEARPGVPECVWYTRMLASMIERGGEIPTMILWSVGCRGGRPTITCQVNDRCGAAT